MISYPDTLTVINSLGESKTLPLCRIENAKTIFTKSADVIIHIGDKISKRYEDGFEEFYLVLAVNNKVNLVGSREISIKSI